MNRTFLLFALAALFCGRSLAADLDPGETKNLHTERPEVVRELKALLESSKAQGRSASRGSPE